MKFVAGCSLLSFLLLSLVRCPGTANASCGDADLRIEGTFVQFQDWMMNMESIDWRLELEAMRRAKIDLVIIQWLHYENSRFMPTDGEGPDPTRAILEYADEHGMRVFLGLGTDDRWHERIGVPRYLIRAEALSKRLADHIWSRYGRHSSFAGWYIPQELRYAKYQPEHIDLIRGFYRRKSDHCRAISGGKPVSISPALPAPSERPTPEAFGSLFAGLLPGCGIDILMLQDGVGAHSWGSAMDTTFIPYFRVMRDVCREAGVLLWSDIEIFKRRTGAMGSEPAPFWRIKKQLAAQSPYVSSFVMFDFFHYMSPYRGEAQKKLYEDYLREYVDLEPPPIEPVPNGTANRAN